MGADLAQQFVDVDRRAYERGWKAGLAASKPNLGLATTKQLLDEIAARIEVHGPGLNYRTVDHG